MKLEDKDIAVRLAIDCTWNTGRMRILADDEPFTAAERAAIHKLADILDDHYGDRPVEHGHCISTGLY